MRTQLAPLIVVKQEFPDFRNNLIGGGIEQEENNNDFPSIKRENDCNNNQAEDLNDFTKKSKKTISFYLIETNIKANRRLKTNSNKLLTD